MRRFVLLGLGGALLVLLLVAWVMSIDDLTYSPPREDNTAASTLVREVGNSATGKRLAGRNYTARYEVADPGVQEFLGQISDSAGGSFVAFGNGHFPEVMVHAGNGRVVAISQAFKTGRRITCNLPSGLDAAFRDFPQITDTKDSLQLMPNIELDKTAQVSAQGGIYTCRATAVAAPN